MAILTYDIMRKYKPFSLNNIAKMTQLIEEVEFLEISKLIGKEIYKKLVADCAVSPIDDELVEILNGGLYKCISYFVYAQYIMNSAITDTFTGMVQKTRQDAENVPIGTLKNEQTRYREIALCAFDDVKCIIEKRYNDCVKGKTKQRFSIHNLRRKQQTTNTNIFDTNYFK